MIPMIVLTGESCVYCKKAKMLIGRALQKNPAFKEVELRYVDQNSPEAAAYPHRLLPAFYADGKLWFEGNPTMQVIERLFSYCLEAGK